MLSVVPHIFSSINFCVRTLVFFKSKKTVFFEGTKLIEFLQSTMFFVQICPDQSEILSTDSKNPGASDGYVQHNKILNLLIIFIITRGLDNPDRVKYTVRSLFPHVEPFQRQDRSSCVVRDEKLFTLEELKRAGGRLKATTAPGIDGVPKEILKEGVSSQTGRSRGWS